MINQAIDMLREKEKTSLTQMTNGTQHQKKRKRGNNQTEGYYQKKLEMKQFKQYKPSFYKKMVFQINFWYFKI